MAIKMMKPGCFMSSIDLRDAYYSVLILPAHRKFLKFVLMARGTLPVHSIAHGADK